MTHKAYQARTNMTVEILAEHDGGWVSIRWPEPVPHPHYGTTREGQVRREELTNWHFDGGDDGTIWSGKDCTCVVDEGDSPDCPTHSGPEPRHYNPEDAPHHLKTNGVY